MRSSRNKIMQSLAVFCLSAAVVVLLSACVIPVKQRPPSATVDKGANPFNADQDVLFRTTYYFRVFDYCVSRDLKRGDFEEVYTPLTDSLYRFRMTGKGRSSWLSKVQFESGTLMAWEVDPFGAKVEFDPELGRARVIPLREIEAEAQLVAHKRHVETMLRMYNDMDNKLLQNGKNLLAAEIENNIKIFGKLPRGPKEYNSNTYRVDGSEKPLSDKMLSTLLKVEVVNVLSMAFPNVAVEEIGKIVNTGFGDDLSVFYASDFWRPGFVMRAVEKTINKFALAPEGENRLQAVLSPNSDAAKPITASTIIGQLKKNKFDSMIMEIEYILSKAGRPKSIHCPDDAPVRRGFQVLGPEGWRTFNQDERLMLAMSVGYKAKPLISTLKELSNRVISSHENTASELPPIVLEQKRISDVHHMLNSNQSDNVKDIATVICKKLVEDINDTRGVCK